MTLKSELKRLVYIAGCGHSGSTLLDMLLGGHSQISNLGEVHRYTLGLGRTSTPFLCTCGKSLQECEFWSRVTEAYADAHGVAASAAGQFFTTNPEYNTLPQDAEDEQLELLNQQYYRASLNQMALVLGSRVLWDSAAFLSEEVRTYQTLTRNSLVLYAAVRRAWQTPVIIDSTKTPVRMKALYLTAKPDMHIIRLVRDGRAVCYSRMRRVNVTMERAIRIWLAEHRKQALMLQTVPDEYVTTVHYEQLCENPSGELERICNRIGLDYEPQMLAFRQNQVHSIGGNPMRFRRLDDNIRLDEKWRKELAVDDLKTFERLGQKLNQQLGYV